MDFVASSTCIFHVSQFDPSPLRMVTCQMPFELLTFCLRCHYLSKMCCARAQTALGSVARGGDCCLCGVFLPDDVCFTTPDVLRLVVGRLNLDVMKDDSTYMSALRLGRGP